MFNKALIIGLGLIGGSIAKVIKKEKISREIYAFDNDDSVISLAKKCHTINDFAPLDKINNFDLIIIATNISCYQQLFLTIVNNNYQNLIVDVGSIKQYPIKILPKELSKKFIACHPIAGSDKSGFHNSFAELFLDKKFIICKTKNNDENDIKTIENFTKKIGAKPDFMSAELHDEIYGLVSHLPQFLSFLTKKFSPKINHDTALQASYRLDNSAPEIWTDIFKFNEKNIEKFYLQFFDNLEYFYKKILRGECEEVLNEIVAFSKDSSNEKIEVKEGFAEIFFRTIVVASYLKIGAITDYRSNAGSGFEDFIKIILVLKNDKNYLLTLLNENRHKIIKFIESIMN
jgi:prephenate dehydrogenase